MEFIWLRVVKCENGVFSGRLVSLVARSRREFPHVEPAQHQVVHPVSAGGFPFQATAARRGAHPPSARQHLAYAHEKHRFGAIPPRSSVASESEYKYVRRREVRGGQRRRGAVRTATAAELE